MESLLPLIASKSASFVEFPDRLGVLHRLRSIEVYEAGMEPLFQLIADRLERKAYDRSAFVFILLELIYELDLDTITFSDMLGRLVFCLTEDLELVGEALEAFAEIQQTLTEPEPDPESPEVSLWKDGPDGESEEGLWNTDEDHEHLMLELQLTQKQCLDRGLSARLAIEMALARSSRHNVRHSLREISALRHSLTRFEELLRESEERMLEAIGVLGQD